MNQEEGGRQASEMPWGQKKKTEKKILPLYCAMNHPPPRHLLECTPQATFHLTIQREDARRPRLAWA